MARRENTIERSFAQVVCDFLGLLKAAWSASPFRASGRDDPVMKAADEVTAAVHIEQVGATFRHIPIAVVVNVVNAGITATVLAAISRTKIPFLWFGAVTLVSIGRWLLWRRYQRAIPQVQNVRTWGLLAGIGSLLAGLSWGLGAAVLLPVTPGPSARQL